MQDRITSTSKSFPSYKQKIHATELFNRTTRQTGKSPSCMQNSPTSLCSRRIVYHTQEIILYCTNAELQNRGRTSIRSKQNESKLPFVKNWLWQKLDCLLYKKAFCQAVLRDQVCQKLTMAANQDQTSKRFMEIQDMIIPSLHRSVWFSVENSKHGTD